MKVGIPRALFYYHFFPQWKMFFESLGWEVVTSPPTNKTMASEGIQCAVSEACFPLKIFYGHVLSLTLRSVDSIFAPRIVSVERKSYICPKFMGIPDMLRAQIKHLPPLIDLNIDMSGGEQNLKRELRSWGRSYGLKPNRVENAWRDSQKEVKALNSICQAGHNLLEGIRIWEGEQVIQKEKADLTIGVLGHCYTLNDSFVSLNIYERLGELGVKIVTAEMLDPHEIEKAAGVLPKRIFWTVGRTMAGAALAMNEDREIDGIIYLACFGCGPDSMVAKVIERRMKKPFMLLTVDEHSGEAGAVTRLEAFCDMLRHKRRLGRENNFSSHGELLYLH